jgi:2'-5' RNA ligase
MLYSLFFLLRGDVGKRHDAFRNAIAQRFGIVSAIKRESHPHVTLKYDVEMDETQLLQLEHALEVFCEKVDKAKAKISGVAHFDKETIYANVIPTYQMQQLHRQLHEMLTSMSWMHFRPYEKEPHLHATLAFRDLSEENFDAVWDFCKTYDIDEDVWFDNIAICPLIDGKRKVYRVFEFGKHQVDE